MKKADLKKSLHLLQTLITRKLDGLEEIECLLNEKTQVSY